MKIICIDDFEDMEFKDVYGLLMLENEKSFEVQIGPDQGHSGLSQARMMEFFIENLVITP